MTRRSFQTRLLAISICAAGFVTIQTGCIQVIRQEAPFYKKGPHQLEPPDGFFEPGTRVWNFGEEDSYARVLSFDGRAGHVWNRDLISVGEWNKLQRQADLNKPKDAD